MNLTLKKADKVTKLGVFPEDNPADGGYFDVIPISGNRFVAVGRHPRAGMPEFGTILTITPVPGMGNQVSAWQELRRASRSDESSTAYFFEYGDEHYYIAGDDEFGDVEDHINLYIGDAGVLAQTVTHGREVDEEISIPPGLSAAQFDCPSDAKEVCMEVFQAKLDDHQIKLDARKWFADGMTDV